MSEGEGLAPCSSQLRVLGRPTLLPSENPSGQPQPCLRWKALITSLSPLWFSFFSRLLGD